MYQKLINIVNFSSSQILQKMDEPTWGLTHYTTLERITHAFHMAEMWTEAAEQYEKIAQIQARGLGQYLYMETIACGRF